MSEQIPSVVMEMSSLRCIRRIVPERDNATVLDFEVDPRHLLGTIAVASGHVFGAHRSDAVQLPQTFDELDQGYFEHETMTVQNADVFQSHSLQLELFSRKAESSELVDEAVSKAYGRIAARTVRRNSRQTQTGKTESVSAPNPLKSDLEEIELAAIAGGFDGRFIVRGMVDLAKRGRGRSSPGNFYAFEIDEDTLGGQMLVEQAAYIDKALRKIVACRSLFRSSLFAQEQANPLYIPFMFVKQSTPGDRVLFEEYVDDKLRSRVAFRLQSPRWKPTIEG